jgi:two-component system chemotaxis response regulator CheY
MDKNMKFLVVDDFATMRRIIRNLLRDLGCSNVVEAEDGNAALNAMVASKIDFVITDIHMPGMDGMELGRQLRGNPQYKEIPILMVTAEASKDMITEAAKIPVDGYIVKPFTANTLKEKIEKILEKKGLG